MEPIRAPSSKKKRIIWKNKIGRKIVESIITSIGRLPNFKRIGQQEKLNIKNPRKKKIRAGSTERQDIMQIIIKW